MANPRISDGTLRVWDLTSHTQLAVFSVEGSLMSCTIYPDGSIGAWDCGGNDPYPEAGARAGTDSLDFPPGSLTNMWKIIYLYLG